MLERYVILDFGCCFNNYILRVPNYGVADNPKYKKLNIFGSF